MVRDWNEYGGVSHQRSALHAMPQSSIDLIHRTFALFIATKSEGKTLVSFIQIGYFYVVLFKTDSHFTSVALSSSKFKKTMARWKTAKNVLHDLSTKRFEYNNLYFESQWTRQRECQTKAMADGSLQRLQEHLIRLLDHKENLRNAEQVVFSIIHVYLFLGFGAPFICLCTY